MQAPLPGNESARLAALKQYGVLDTPPEQAFNDLIRLAAYICGTPISLISLIDDARQWFKASSGTRLHEGITQLRAGRARLCEGAHFFQKIGNQSFLEKVLLFYLAPFNTYVKQ